MSNSKDSSTPPNKAYKYCFRCSGRLSLSRDTLRCEDCGYQFPLRPIPTVGIIITNADHEVLLTRRKFAPYKGKWQTPGGFMRLGETYEQAILREVREELGVTVRLEEFLGVTPEVYPFEGVALPTIVLYRRGIIAQGTIVADDDVEEARFFKVADLASLDIAYPSIRAIAGRGLDIAPD